uniref:SDR family NAD(P)-dependent oxidoreductase n=1 Tax=Nocardia neocaledoniensis TaxID=236511 RepID=UPI002457F17F
MTQTIALVTGGNKGLGRETVRRLAGSGWRVFLAARDKSRGEAAAADHAAAGRDVRFVALGVTTHATHAPPPAPRRAPPGPLARRIN